MSAPPKSIKVLIAEDSAVQRLLLGELLSEDPQLQVIGCARDGVEAVKQAASSRPDVILMDVNMPRMNGFEATRQILAETPTPIVMTSASIAGREHDLSFAALEAGALTLLAKPGGIDDPGHRAAAAQLITTIKLMSEITVVRRWPRRPMTDKPPTRNPIPGRRARAVAIAASTGGPSIIPEILAQLAGRLNAAVLIVQHMAPGFMASYAEWLAQRTGLPVTVPCDGDPILPDHVYLAPDDHQMGVAEGERIALCAGVAENGFCPSGSYLLRSVAAHYGAGSIGVVLTGMGADGAEGLLRVRQAGGLTIAQNAESCAVFGMPKEAIALGAAEHILAPDDIAAMIRTLVSHGDSHVDHGPRRSG